MMRKGVPMLLYFILYFIYQIMIFFGCWLMEIQPFKVLLDIENPG